MTSIALDSNVAISILNGELDLESVFPNVEIFFLPVTVCGELLFGAKNSSRVQTNQEQCWKLIGVCNIIQTTTSVSDEYASIRVELKKLGRPIPENDIWIAAACRANQIPIATRDRHFGYVSGITVIHP